MKRMGKRLTALILAAVLLLCLMAPSALAAGGAFTDVSAAGSYLREQMMDRKTSVSILYEAAVSDEGALQELINSLSDAVLKEALAPTSDPRSGAYLEIHMLSYETETAASYYPGGSGYEVEAELKYTFSWASTKAQEAQVDTQIASVLGSLGASDSAYDRIRRVYDYVCGHVTYDDAGAANNTPGSHSCYAALVGRKAVCQGYSALVLRLLTELGVENRVVTGWDGDYRGEHAWNMAKIGSKWYFLDATWDAVRQDNYEYFLRGTSDFYDHAIQNVGMYVTSDISDYPMAGSAYAGTGTETVPDTGTAKPVTAGWKQTGGRWWYQNAGGGYPRNRWQKIGGAWYHFDASGYMQTGWLRSGGAWYYLRSSGAMATGWEKIGGRWYYFGGSGVMQTGWLRSGGAWYYLQASGAMATGWQRIGGHWYYFGGAGVMQTGWLRSGGAWYFLQASGAMATGWQRIGGHWYYFGGSGVMQTGWLRSGSTWYYFKPSGAMAAGETVNGYTFAASGAWTA